MKRTEEKKLVLTTQAVRVLSAKELATIQGGALCDNTCRVVTQCAKSAPF